jgi:hypothetical protein
MRKIIRIQKKDHIQKTLDGEELELSLIREGNKLNIDVYPTSFNSKLNTLSNKGDVL